MEMWKADERVEEGGVIRRHVGMRDLHVVAMVLCRIRTM